MSHTPEVTYLQRVGRAWVKKSKAFASDFRATAYAYLIAEDERVAEVTVYHRYDFSGFMVPAAGDSF